MLRIVIVLFVLVPILELWGLITVGRWIGAWPTILLVIMTGLFGAWFAKKEGLQTIQLARLKLARGEVPGFAIIDGICIFLGGAMLILPGFFTDALGLILLIPYTRNIIKAWLKKKLESWIRSGGFIILRK